MIWEKNHNEYDRLHKTIKVRARSCTRFRKPRNRENASAVVQEAAPRQRRVKSQLSHYFVIYAGETIRKRRITNSKPISKSVC